MIILRKVHNELSLLSEHEECGFLAGRKVVTKRYKVKNVSKDINGFEMGFWSKFWAIIKSVFTLRNILCIYHVHSNSPFLSEMDKKNMMEGIIYLVICKGYLFFYRKTNNEIKIVEEVIL